MYYQSPTAQYMYMQPYMYTGGAPLASTMMSQQYQYPGQAMTTSVDNYSTQSQVMPPIDMSKPPLPQQPFPPLENTNQLAPKDGDEEQKLNQLKQQAQQWKSQQQSSPAWSYPPPSIAPVANASSVMPTATATTAIPSMDASNSQVVPSSVNDQTSALMQPNLDKEEEEFDKQFNEWEQQFETWKSQNINHPDKESFAKYEQEWQKWRAQLLQKKEQMQKDKAARLAAAGVQDASQSLVSTSASISSTTAPQISSSSIPPASIPPPATIPPSTSIPPPTTSIPLPTSGPPLGSMPPSVPLPQIPPTPVPPSVSLTQVPPLSTMPPIAPIISAPGNTSVTNSSLPDPNMFYPPPQYMYMQPYMYPGGVSVPPVMPPQTFPYPPPPISSTEQNFNALPPTSQPMTAHPPLLSDMGKQDTNQKLDQQLENRFPPNDGPNVTQRDKMPLKNFDNKNIPSNDHNIPPQNYDGPNISQRNNMETQNFDGPIGPQNDNNVPPQNFDNSNTSQRDNTPQQNFEGPPFQRRNKQQNFDIPDKPGNFPPDAKFEGDWNFNRGRGRGRGRARGRGARGRGQGRWVEASEIEDQLSSSMKAKPPLLDNPFNIDFADSSDGPPPYEYPTEDSLGEFASEHDKKFNDNDSRPNGDNHPKDNPVQRGNFTPRGNASFRGNNFPRGAGSMRGGMQRGGAQSRGIGFPRENFLSRDNFPLREDFSSDDNFPPHNEFFGPREKFQPPRENFPLRDNLPLLREPRDNFPNPRDNFQQSRNNFPSSRENFRDNFPPSRDNFPPSRDNFPIDEFPDQFSNFEGPHPNQRQFNDRFPHDRKGFPSGPRGDNYMMDENFNQFQDHPLEGEEFPPGPFHDQPCFDERRTSARGRFSGRGRRPPQGNMDERFGPRDFPSGMRDDGPFASRDFSSFDDRFGPNDPDMPPRMPLIPGGPASFDQGFGPSNESGRFQDDKCFPKGHSDSRFIDYSHRPASSILGDEFNRHSDLDQEFQYDLNRYRDNFSSNVLLAPGSPITFSKASVEWFDYGHGIKPLMCGMQRGQNTFEGESTSEGRNKKEFLSDNVEHDKFHDWDARRNKNERRGEKREWESNRDRDRERERERDRDRNRDRDRDRDRKENSEHSTRDRNKWDKDKNAEKENKKDNDWDKVSSKDENKEKRMKWENKQNKADKNFNKEKSNEISKKNEERNSKAFNATEEFKADIKNETVGDNALIEDLLNIPKRLNRPKQLVVILRGLPGSGKTYVAKLIKDKEIENGGSAPRILSLDDYFMVEKEITETDPDTGKRVKRKEFQFEYELEMEEAYRSSLFKSFKKTVDDRFFPFIIVDAVHEKTKQYEQYWSYAKQRGFQVYIAEMDCKDPVICHKRNIHNRTLEEITQILDNWEKKPRHFFAVDIRSLLQDVAIREVEMEVESEDKKETKSEIEENEKDENAEANAFMHHVPSRWEKLEATEAKLDQLDGLRVNKKKHSSMEDYLQLPDDYENRKCEPGKKRVRWADLEERKEQDRLRAIGFVVGQTDWSKLTDPTHADRALTRTKYF